MAKKQQRPRPEPDQPSKIQQLMNRSRETQEAQQKTDGRGQPGHAGQRGRDKRGQEKVTYYLPLNRQNLVREIASHEDVSQTDIAEAAIVAFYNAWQKGEINLDSFKSPARSLKVSWKLAIPNEFEICHD